MSYESGPWGDGMNEPMRPVTSSHDVRSSIILDLVSSLSECLAIVRVQNGNRHADVNEIMERASAAIKKATGQ